MQHAGPAGQLQQISKASGAGGGLRVSTSRASLGLTCDLILGLISFEGSKLRFTVSHSSPHCHHCRHQLGPGRSQEGRGIRNVAR